MEHFNNTISQLGLFDIYRTLQHKTQKKTSSNEYGKFTKIDNVLVHKRNQTNLKLLKSHIIYFLITEKLKDKWKTKIYLENPPVGRH